MIAALNAPIVISKDATEKSLATAQLAQVKQLLIVTQCTINAAEMQKRENKIRLLREWISLTTDLETQAKWHSEINVLQEEYLSL